MRDSRLREDHSKLVYTGFPRTCSWPWLDPVPQKLLSQAEMVPWRDGGGLTESSWWVPSWGSRWRCSPVKWEQPAVTVEGIATQVDQLQLTEIRQGRQGLQLVLL